MTSSTQPPEGTFCLTCGPDTALERQNGAVLHCPRCGTRQPVPDFPLFVVTGASGTGKTTITAPLRRALPGCDVFDIDIILQVAALGWDTWRNTWLRLAHAITLNGRVTVLCGSLMPDQTETLPVRKLVGPIRFCTLDWPNAVLADRLRRRPAWRGTSTEDAIARHQRFATWLRTHIQPATTPASSPRRDRRPHRQLDSRTWTTRHRRRRTELPPSPAPVTVEQLGAPIINQTVHAWRVGDQRAETYLRLRAEAELRRAGAELRRLDAAAEDAWADPGIAPFRTSEMAGWKVVRAGRILVAAGVLDQDYLDHLASDFHAAIKVRSRLLLNWDRRRGMLHRTFSQPAVSRPSPGASQAMRAAPIGRALRITSERAPWTLHLVALVRTQTQAVITVAMRMHWPPDGSTADLGLTGAGPHHMPYDQLWAVDDWGSRYAVRLEGGRDETVTWFGMARLSPVPPRHVRWLDLVGDGTRLAQLPLGLDESPPGRGPVPSAAEPVATCLGERLPMLEAERILTSADARGPAEGPGPGEIITVLTEACAIAADSPVPGQLAALCQRLGAAGPGITVQPAGEIPAPWASVIAHREGPAGGADVFAPLACVLPDVDGARIVLAGLSSAAGQSYLHVISSGLPPLARRYQWDWTPGLSFWLRDSSGNWHVAMADEPRMPEDGMQAYPLDDGMQVFWLRLTPPLDTIPDAAEIVVTGPATRVRVTVLVHPAGS